MCGFKATDRFSYNELREREPRNRLCSYSDGAKEVDMVWTCVKKRRE